MDGTKLKGIKTWPEPKTVKDVRDVLRFLQLLSEIHRSLRGNIEAAY